MWDSDEIGGDEFGEVEERTTGNTGGRREVTSVTDFCEGGGKGGGGGIVAMVDIVLGQGIVDLLEVGFTFRVPDRGELTSGVDGHDDYTGQDGDNTDDEEDFEEGEAFFHESIITLIKVLSKKKSL